MSQISPPLRILLAGSVLFLAAWFVMLRPSAEPTPAPPAAPAAAPGEGLASNPNGPTAKTSVGRAVQKANGAAQATEEASVAHGGTIGEGASQPAKPKTATPGAATTAPATKPGAAAPADSDEVTAPGLPTDVAEAIASKKVLVMLFWNPAAADDRMVRRELRGIDRHKGAVKVHVANVEDIARYAPITRGVNLEQSPSVVVIGADHKADLLSGWTDREAIDQTVSDALRAR